MKNNLLRDMEIALSMCVDNETKETVMHCIISAMRNYDVIPIVRDLTVRHEMLNEDILKKYAACLLIDGKTKSTAYQYIRMLRKLSEVTGKPFTDMKVDDIRYFLGLSKKRGLKNSSIENQRSYIASFFQWLHDEEEIEKNPCRKIKTIKVEEEIRLPFSPVEIDKLRSSCKRTIDRAIMELLLSSGVRCEELCNLKVVDIDLSKRIVNVKCGKGGKDRVTFMSDVAAEHIRKYLNSRKLIGPFLFIPASKNDRFSTRSIEAIVGRTGLRAEVEDVHPHRFRRTFATDLYKHGMDIASISKLMGHANIEVTKRYVHISNEQLYSEYRRIA